MIENSSPSLMPKLTSVSARTPPNRSETPRTSRLKSTKNPSPATALDRALRHVLMKSYIGRQGEAMQLLVSIPSRPPLCRQWEQGPHRRKVVLNRVKRYFEMSSA